MAEHISILNATSVIAPAHRERCLHVHESYEIMALLEGQIHQVERNGASAVMNTGELYHAPPGVEHGSFNPVGTLSSFFVINFDTALFEHDRHDKFSVTRMLEQLTKSSSRNLQLASLQGETWLRMSSLFDKMVKEFVEQRCFFRDQLRSSLKELFLMLLRDSSFRERHGLDHPEDEHSLIDHVLFFMSHQFYQNDFCVDDIVSRYPISRSHFFKLFKAATGQTFTEKLNEIRLAEAQNLLLSTELSVTDILYRSGYSNPSHFGHLFKERFGLSPRDYRKLHS